jgi:hypothetical protein
MASTKTAFSSLIAPGLRKVFFDEFKALPEEFSQIFNVDSSSQAYEDELAVTGLGRFERKNEHEPIVYDDPIQGGKVRYTHNSFGLGFRVSRELYDDDLYSVMKRMSKQLSISARQCVEIEAAALLNDAQTGSLYTGFDTKQLLYSAHPLLIGSTYGNTPSASHVDLSITSLRVAMETQEQCVNERGLPIYVPASRLVVAPAFQWIAKEILGSDAKPYTSDNELNVFKDAGLTYMVYHYFTGTASWLMLAPKNQYDLKFFWRTKPEFRNSDDYDTLDAKFSGFMRFSVGFSDWRGVYGSI